MWPGESLLAAAATTGSPAGGVPLELLGVAKTAAAEAVSGARTVGVPIWFPTRLLGGMLVPAEPVGRLTEGATRPAPNSAGIAGFPSHPPDGLWPQPAVAAVPGRAVAGGKLPKCRLPGPVSKVSLVAADGRLDVLKGSMAQPLAGLAPALPNGND